MSPGAPLTAKESCTTALAASRLPTPAEAHVQSGKALAAAGQYAAALDRFTQAIALQPACAENYVDQGNAFSELKQFAAAFASYEQAIALKPALAAAHWNKALLCLLTGDYESGWALLQWRWRLKPFLAAKACADQVAPQWLGAEPLAGKTILLRAEQGLGDTLQLVRYVEPVLALGARVFLEVPEGLRELFKPLAGRVGLCQRGGPFPAHDYYCHLLSLPLAFQTRLAPMPPPRAYLVSDPGKRRSWAERLGPKLRPRIGLVWSGNPQHKNDHKRSLPLGELLPRLPAGCDYVSLQKALREADKAALEASGIRHFGDALQDFADTAALCDLMDVVISVDTSVAHLAGALGKPTWILLPYVPDWRWLLDRDDSPWYPAARLYRQPAIGDWASVLARVRDDLLSLRARITPLAKEKERVLRIITVDLESKPISVPDIGSAI